MVWCLRQTPPMQAAQVRFPVWTRTEMVVGPATRQARPLNGSVN